VRAKILIAAVLLAALAATPESYASSPSQSDLAFLETLSAPQELPPAVGMPEPQLRSCSVSNDCQDSTSVSCVGNSSCQTTIAGVKCDGVETQCPNFCTIGMSCQCCSGSYSGSCWSRRGDCQYTNNGIACNGHEFTCQTTCPLCPEW
jgi:hypothetical protein